MGLKTIGVIVLVIGIVMLVAGVYMLLAMETSLSYILVGVSVFVNAAGLVLLTTRTKKKRKKK